MRVLYYIPYFHTVGADRWIYLGWKHAFEDLGHEFRELTVEHDWRRALREFKPHILFITNFPGLAKRQGDLLWARAQGIAVYLVVDWPMAGEEVAIVRDHDVADVYFGEREPESMREFEKATRRTYHLIPNAADKRLHFPTDAIPKYEFDLVYMGAYLPKKRQMFEEILFPLMRKYRVGIFGPCWTLSDNILRTAQKVCRKLKLLKMAESVNKRRVQIPPEEENQLYSSAKISLNFHEREPDGSQPHYILNQRTFKIAACGGFQICDHVPALRQYFTEEEVVMATTPSDWFQRVDYYLSHSEERKALQMRGTARALRDHTYHNRVKQVLDLYQEFVERRLSQGVTR